MNVSELTECELACLIREAANHVRGDCPMAELSRISELLDALKAIVEAKSSQRKAA